MKFITHRLLTEIVIQKIKRTDDQFSYESQLKLGSIYPDLSISHYMPRMLFPNKSDHRIEDSLDTVKELLKGVFQEALIEKDNYSNMFFEIGKIMHYLADFVCLPHTPLYKGGVGKHVAYEKMLGKEVKRHQKTYFYDLMLADVHLCDNADEFLKLFYKKYDKYINGHTGMATDITYALEISSDLLHSVVHLMKKVGQKVA